MSDDETKDPEAGEGADGEKANKAASSSSRPSRRKRRKRPAGDASEGKGTVEAKDVAKPKEAASTKGDEASPGEPGERRDLPKWNRARVKRKAPKGEEQDAFQATVRKAGKGILQRPAVVIGLIVAVGGIGAGAYAWMQSRSGDRAQATTLLATAAAYEARGAVVEDLATQIGDRVRPLPAPVVATDDELRQTIDGALGDLEESAASSAANETADLIRAARLARAKDFEGAEKAYRGFIQRLPGHRLIFMAREGLVLSLEGQERWDDALAEVDPMLGEAGDFYRDQALWHRGRLLEAAGRGDEALEVYKQYMEEYPLEQPSLASDEVRARLEELDPGSVPPLPETGIPGMGGLGGLGIGP